MKKIDLYDSGSGRCDSGGGPGPGSLRQRLLPKGDKDMAEAKEHMKEGAKAAKDAASEKK